jgi:hypothetical protein
MRGYTTPGNLQKSAQRHENKGVGVLPGGAGALKSVKRKELKRARRESRATGGRAGDWLRVPASICRRGCRRYKDGRGGHQRARRGASMGKAAGRRGGMGSQGAQPIISCE